MKKAILFLMVVVVAMVSCEKDKVEELDKGKLDPNAMVLIRAAKGVKTRSFVEDLTAQQIVEQALNIKWQSHWFGGSYHEEAKFIGRSFDVKQRDLDIPALKMWGTDIIGQLGEMTKDFIYGYSVYLTDNNNDTIGYIPDEVINTARTLIISAYEDENYNEVYRLFDEAFTFSPMPSK